MRFLKFLSAGIFVFTSFAALFFMVYVINKKNDDIQARDERILRDSLRLVEKDHEINKLSTTVLGLKGTYENLQKTFQSLSDRFVIMERSNDSLKSRIEQLSASVNKLKKEKDEIQGKVEYIERYNPISYNLNSAEIASVAESLGKRKKGESAFRKLTAQEENEIQNARLAVANFLVTSHDTVIVYDGYAENSKKLVCQFEVQENQRCQKGKKELFIQIVRPDGSIYNYLKNSGLFWVDGKQESYSTKISLNYNQKRELLSFSFANKSILSPGTYKIVVYESGKTIGSSHFTIN